MLCRSDARKASRYLMDASRFYDAHAKGAREQDRARLLRLLARKIERKIKEETK